MLHQSSMKRVPLPMPSQKELQRLKDNGVYRHIEKSERASPIVVVLKDDGQIRLCGDYKVTINSAVVDQPYMIPTAEDIFATLASGSQHCMSNPLSSPLIHAFCCRKGA